VENSIFPTNSQILLLSFFLSHSHSPFFFLSLSHALFLSLSHTHSFFSYLFTQPPFSSLPPPLSRLFFLALSPPLSLSRALSPLQVNEMRLRMATLPENCDVLFTEGMWVPLAVVSVCEGWRGGGYERLSVNLYT